MAANRTSFKPGADPRRNPGGNKGCGRKKLEFVAECEGLADTEVMAKVRQKLTDPRATVDDAGWRWAAEYVSQYSKSKAPTQVKATHDGELTMQHCVVMLPPLGEGKA